MTTLLLWIVVTMILVLVHELGHYLAARLTKVGVEVFSIGFGKKIYAWQDKYLTTYQISIVPLGGYVLLASKGLHSINNAKYYQKMLIVLAGPVFSIIFGFLIIFCSKLYFLETNIKPIIGDIKHDSILYQHNIRAGDLLVTINGQQIASYKQAIKTMSEGSLIDNKIVINYQRNDMILTESINVPVESIHDRNSYLKFLARLGLKPVSLMNNVIANVVKNSPADGALKVGEQIIEIDGLKMNNFTSISTYVAKHPNTKITITSIINGKTVRKSIITGLINKNNQEIGFLGIGTGINHSLINFTRNNFLDAFVKSWFSIGDITKMFFVSIYKMITNKISIDYLSSPLEMSIIMKKSLDVSIRYFIEIVGFFSFSLGLINLLPIPILDGGQALIFSIEKFTGVAVNDKIKACLSKISMSLLAVLFLVILYNDLLRILHN